MRKKLKETGDYKSFFRKVRTTIKDRIDRLDHICNMINNGKKIALLCFESDPKKCHRYIVADEIIKRDGNGLKIKHIEPLQLK